MLRDAIAEIVKRIIILSVLVLLIFIALAATFGLSPYVTGKIEDSLAESCPECEFKIGRLQISPLKGVALANFISFSSDSKSNTTVKVKAFHVEIQVNLSKLLTREIEITKITLKDFKVSVEEKYNPEKDPATDADLKKLEESYGGKFLEGMPEAKILAIVLENGTLEYTMKKFGKEAKLKVSEINAEISALSTRKEIGPKYTYANLTAKFQESGAVILKLRADLFSVKNDDKIEIAAKHQNMSELDVFFGNEDGILMSGEINEIHATVDLTQGIITGDLWADYKDLKLEMKPTPETGALVAALTNVVQKIKIAQTKPKPGEHPPHAEVLYQRLPGQGIVKFIIQGLKEAAFKVASN